MKAGAKGFRYEGHLRDSNPWPSGASRMNEKAEFGVTASAVAATPKGVTPSEFSEQNARIVMA